MSFLVDSNILCRLSDKNDPHYEEARKAVRLLLDRGEALFIVPQVEREFWVVATRPGEQNGLGLLPAEAAGRLKSFRDIFGFRDDSPDLHGTWRQLVVDHRVSGKTAHDAGIAAAALTHQFDGVLTFNRQDFERYGSRLEIKTPREVIEELTR